MIAKASLCTALLVACIYGSDGAGIKNGCSFDVSIAEVAKRNKTVEAPLFIGSFNVQTLGKKKFVNVDVMDVVERVILRYDLFFLTELSDDCYVKRLLNDVNYAAPDGVVYNMTLSEKHPSTSEQYAFFYRTDKLRVFKSESYDDPQQFFRKPLVTIFEAFTLRDMERFAAIGHHVKPSNAPGELSAMADIYDYVARKYKVKDAILMGDFNADCDYIKERHWENIALWTRSEFTWAIDNSVDTTTNYKSCALDRFVLAGDKMKQAAILSSAKAFNFQQEYSLSTYETRNVSDHWPIELKIRGKLSHIAEKHLTADVCFTIRDSQKRNVTATQTIATLAKKSSFQVSETLDGIVLSKNGTETTPLLLALKNLPGVVSRELEEAVKYKVEHGGLKDESSYADHLKSEYKITVLAASEFSVASVCRSTSVN